MRNLQGLRSRQAIPESQIQHRAAAPVTTQTELTDVKTLRARARKHLEEGAVTPGYSADRSAVLRLLNNALATEIVCVLRYRRHHFMARGIDAKSTGAEPDFAPDGLSGRSHAEYVAGASLVEMIKEDLVAERITIDSYRELICYLGEHDPTTSHMLRAILAVEEEHADELADLLKGLPVNGARKTA